MYQFVMFKLLRYPILSITTKKDKKKTSTLRAPIHACRRFSYCVRYLIFICFDYGFFKDQPIVSV